MDKALLGEAASLDGGGGGSPLDGGGWECAPPPARPTAEGMSWAERERALELWLAMEGVVEALVAGGGGGGGVGGAAAGQGPATRPEERPKTPVALPPI